MFEELYKNIGEKIKTWAIWIFIVEAIGSIIAGIVMMGNYLEVSGILTLFIGPLVALVSSWILYAFGQLVEDVHAIRNKEGTTEEVKARHKAEDSAAEKLTLNTVAGDTKCQICGEYVDHLTYCKIDDDYGTRYRHICDSCMQKYNAQKP